MFHCSHHECLWFGEERLWFLVISNSHAFAMAGLCVSQIATHADGVTQIWVRGSHYWARNWRWQWTVCVQCLLEREISDIGRCQFDGKYKSSGNGVRTMIELFSQARSAHIAGRGCQMKGVLTRWPFNYGSISLHDTSTQATSTPYRNSTKLCWQVNARKGLICLLWTAIWSVKEEKFTV